jgi:hypothetical protein
MTEIILNGTVHLSGDKPDGLGHFFRTSDLLNMSPNDTDVTAKTVGHGSHVVRDEDIRRGQRTVGLTGFTMADSLDSMEALIQELEQWPEQHVTARFIGQGRDLEVTGIWSLDRPTSLNPVQVDWSATLLCESPYLLSHDVQTIYLQASASAEGGLQWGSAGLLWPLQWGSDGLDGNSGIVYNAGNAFGGPVITVHGSWPSGVTVSDSTGRSLVYDGPVLSGSPLVLDCDRRVATVGGVNRSYMLSKREWFTVPPKCDLGLSFLPHTAGTGWAEVNFQDHYL